MGHGKSVTYPLGFLGGAMGRAIPYIKLSANWPSSMPLLCLGGQGWVKPLLATAFEEVSWDDLKAGPFLSPDREGSSLGLIGIVSYDQFSPSAQNKAPSRFFRINEAIQLDPLAGELKIEGRPARRQGEMVLERDHLLGLFALLAEEPRMSPGQGLLPEGVITTASLVGLNSKENYLEKAARALQDIRNGSYYQVNLLRYFRCLEEPTEAALAARMDAFAGPMSALIKVPGLRLYSFSPERFIDAQKIKPLGSTVSLTASPIKGTAPRSQNAEEDGELKKYLSQSPKNLAELAMIVDLMRHDLGRISRPRSVKVVDPGRVHSFSHVHHLVASIRSEAPASLSLAEFLTSVCPAGSITGAPKLRVMEAIREFEERDRRYFMGHIFYWDGGESLASSILIRTAIAEGNQGGLEYAAGSGLVIHSDPEEEFQEIETKTKVFSCS